MEITQEQAKIIHEWFSKLLAVDPSKIRGSDFTLAYIIKDAAQQSVQPTIATAALEDSPFETGMRRNAVVLPNRNSG